MVPREGVGMRILVVEDYTPIREALGEGLRGEGIAVDATGDGEEGLWYATSHDYDLILLDIMLPGRSGLDILGAVRTAGKDVPVLLMTAKDEISDRVRGLDLGADDYLVKPFALAELYARVRALTRRKYGTRNPRLVIEDLELDTVARQVRRGGNDIPLTQREYALLEFLALHAGTVVSRSAIWEHLYDFADESTSNVIEATILRLRRKLDPDGCAPLLHTRRGFGYVLGADGGLG
jgi:DNA-binding response OmpR family regulator